MFTLIFVENFEIGKLKIGRVFDNYLLSKARLQRHSAFAGGYFCKSDAQIDALIGFCHRKHD